MDKSYLEHRRAFNNLTLIPCFPRVSVSEVEPQKSCLLFNVPHSVMAMQQWLHMFNFANGEKLQARKPNLNRQLTRWAVTADTQHDEASPLAKLW